jgi:hypothetical protein
MSTYIVRYTFEGKRKSITVHSDKSFEILLATLRGDTRYSDVSATFGTITLRISQ